MHNMKSQLADKTVLITGGTVGKWLLSIGGVLVALVALLFGALHLGLVPRPFVTAVLGLRYPEVNPVQIASSRTLATFAPDTFLEGVAVDTAGDVFVSGMQSDQGGVWRYANGQVTPVAHRSGFFGTLAFHPNNTLYAIFTRDTTGDPAARRYQLVTLGDDGSTTPILTFPIGAMPNGMCFDENGNLYIADSLLGHIWRVADNATALEVWLADETLFPQSMPGIPGANGIRLWQNALYVTNSSTGEFIRIPINAAGGADTPMVVTHGVPGDDFAFDTEGNAYVTTHPFNVLIKVSSDGGKTTVGDASNGMVGPTNAAFGKSANDQALLYVVTDGGAFLDLVPYPFNRLFPQEKAAPSILQVQVQR
jgi:uncharacterized membrane protein